MDIKIIIFLAFTSAAVFTNALLLLFAWQRFTRMVLKFSEAARKFETSGTTKEWLMSLQHFSEEARRITESANHAVTAQAATFERAQARYEETLGRIDTSFGKFEGGLSEKMSRLQESVEGPASKIEMFAAGMKGVASSLTPEE